MSRHYEVRDRYTYSSDGHLIDLSNGCPSFNEYLPVEGHPSTHSMMIGKMVVWVEDSEAKEEELK